MKEIEFLKEMKYQKDRKMEIIGKGEINGRKWFILNLGHHPTAYVELKQEELEKSKKYDDYNLDVHGGFTFLGNPYWDEEDKSTYIGWDYAHCDDFCGICLDEFWDNTYFLSCDKQWTIKEIFEEVKQVIKQFDTAKWVNGILEVEE